VTAVEVWYVRTGDVAGDGLLRACDGVLSAQERQRGRALRFERDRHEHLVTRALARGVLGRALDANPSSLSFCRGAHGRPELRAPGDLRFNLTNTTALVACAVARGREVGVDAEASTRADEILEVAHVVFTEAERERLQILAPPARRIRAVQLWTAKEAYIKARGLGFSLPPAKIELDVREDGIDLRFLEELGDVPSRWDIVTREIEGHTVGVCSERLAPERCDVVMRRANLADLLAPAAGVGCLTRTSTMQPSAR
jgi:4'-phosphopantetheinyl transferase